MSGGFRDSFTKEDTKEDLLGYDDTAFYYFAITCLTCVALPWTVSVIYNSVLYGKSHFEKDISRKTSQGSTFRYCKTQAMVDKVDNAKVEARKQTASSVVLFILKMVVLLTMWGCVYGTVIQLGQEKEIKKFDPFDILDVTPAATHADIRRAYRKLSLNCHPDKNHDDPLAASRFIQITKAYQALTDDVARKNWEKFGNPDGPQTTKIGIGLPKLLLQKENSLTILCVFFFIIIFLVPVTFICYYQRQKNFAPTGVLIETLGFLGGYVTESTRVKGCPELLAACAEGRFLRPRSTDAADALKLHGQVIQHKKGSFTLPSVIRNQLLIWGHMQRKHSVMSPELRSDCDLLLRHSMKLTQAMFEVACMREWFATSQAVLEFRRCLVQALDIKSSQLLQVPHVTEEFLETFRMHSTPVTTLLEFLALDAYERRALLHGLNEQQMLDVDAFCDHVGLVELTARVEVEDESEIVVGDIATVTAKIERTRLADGEAMGPVHAPHFPRLKLEEWWFLLAESAPTTRMIAFERIRDMEKIVEDKLRFQVTKPGKNSLVLYAMCDAYAGLDQKVELSFTAYAEDEYKRAWNVHTDDVELDSQPGFLQQWMGDLRQYDESDEEEDEDGTSRSRKADEKRPSDDGGRKRSESDAQSKAARNKAADADESSNSSSDSE